MAAERARGQEDPLEAPAETAEPLELAQSEDRKTGGWTEREGGERGGRAYGRAIASLSVYPYST